MEFTEEKLKEFVARLRKEKASQALINAARSKGIADALRLTYPQFLEVGKTWDSIPSGDPKPEVFYNLCRSYDDKAQNFSIKIKRVAEEEGFEGTYNISVVSLVNDDPVQKLSGELRRNYMWKWWEGFILAFGTARKEIMLF